jgi:hypothetical protein
MITDADIFWPINLKELLPPLYPDCLYGFPRRVIMREDVLIFEKNQMHGLVEGIDELYLGGDYTRMATIDDLKIRLPHDPLSTLRGLRPYLYIEEPEIFTAMGWNSDVESTKENPLPLGYGQLYNCQIGDNWYPEDFDTAAGCDAYFSSQWGQNKRKFLETFTVLHIGPRMVHWDGRKKLW